MYDCFQRWQDALVDRPSDAIIRRWIRERVDLQLEANLDDVQRRDAESGNEPSYTTRENDLLSAALSGSQLSWRPLEKKQCVPHL